MDIMIIKSRSHKWAAREALSIAALAIGMQYMHTAAGKYTNKKERET
jgi:hypothetical protein